jgi:dienelactone hydrolase
MEIRFHGDMNIPIDDVTVSGELTIPLRNAGIVIFSHGSGSSRFSKRNQAVAKYLQKKGIGTLLFDLLTEEEDQSYHTRFDIDLLTRRLAGATEWLERLPAAKDCRIGYFGASTGAASALKAAAFLPSIRAVVSRGGRPDLAMDVLGKIKAPTLLIVGGLDYDVLNLNQQAYMKLNCVRQLEIIEGATHLFEETGKLETVAALAASWFENHLAGVSIHH